MWLLWIATGVALFFSLVKSPAKTREAILIGFKKFAQLLDEFGLLLVLVSVAFVLLPPHRIETLLQGRGMFLGSVIAAIVGAVTFIPGFIAYPLAGILREKGVPVTVLAALLTTMMMVGFLTLPLEEKLFGRKLAIVRNIVYFLMAIVVSAVIGVVFGELP